MQVYYKTHTAFCFSSKCKTHGKAIDALDFIMMMENITKHEAIKKAVEMIGGETKPMDELTKSAVLMKMFTYFKNAIPNSPQAKDYIKSRHLDHEKMEIGYNSGQFHHGTRRDEDLINSCIKYGLLLDLNTKGRTGEAAYSPFGKWCIVFALRNQSNQITGLYFRSTLAEKEQRHFYLKDRHGLYPSYPKQETKKLILTESIIDAATLMMIESIKSNYEILALYGTNGLTDEHQKAIKELKELNEIIFFLNGDEPGVKAVQKYAPMLKVEYPNLKIFNVEVPQNEDVNSLLNGHSEEILTHLINSRKETNFLFSSENKPLGNEEELEYATPELFVPTESEQSQAVKRLVQESLVKTDCHPSEASKPKGLDAQNPYNLKYKTEAAHYQIKGFKIDQMASLKITLQISI